MALSFTCNITLKKLQIANIFSTLFNKKPNKQPKKLRDNEIKEIAENINGVLGKDAEIISNSASVWYWYLSGGVAIALIGTITTIVVVSRKRKKQREKMSAK